jgi:ankyrin repeat protein
MSGIPLDEALSLLGRTDPAFNEEVRRRLAPVKDRFLQTTSARASDRPGDGLHTAPPYLSDPELRNIAVELSELALQRGIDINLACNPDGSTLLHECVLLRESTIAIEAVTWLLAHGADPNRRRDDGQTPLSLALSLDRKVLAELMVREK